MPGGRPTKFQPEFVEQARKLARYGATDREIAEFFDVTEQTLNNWKGEHPEFFESLKLGKEASDARVEKSLYRRALGYSHDAVKIMAVEGEVVREPYVEHYPPDTTACIFWLKNRKPEEWRDKQVHDVNHNLAEMDEVIASTRAIIKEIAAAKQSGIPEQSQMAGDGEGKPSNP